MSTPATPASPKPAGDDRNLVPVDATTATSFEDKVHLFWQKNGTAVLACCGLVVLGFLAKGGWDYMAAQKELGIEKDYAAATTPDQLKAFAASHTGHSLAGIALLRVADEAYAAGKAADALAGYEKAQPPLKGTPLASRAKLGIALSKIAAGKTAEGSADLKLIADAASEPKIVRVEAGYHLASLAAEAGNAADVQKYSEQIMKLDPQSPWAQRAFGLRASLPAPKAAEAAPAAAKPDEKKSEASPNVQVKLPGAK
ncbi:MAG: hypothetical protein HZA93_11520 [Verrucomicrobia bacterium]|nr:hypothetical protein [Verrucomicrobiota bacterium]